MGDVGDQGDSSLGALPFATPVKPEAKRASAWWILVFLLAMVIALVWSSLPPLSRNREAANRIYCAAKLLSIGQAIIAYANDNRGRYPTSVEALLLNTDLRAHDFVCPSSKDKPAEGETLPASRDAVAHA
jgi:hypothetical protein